MVTSLKITPKVSFVVILEACEPILGMSLRYNLTSWCILQLLPQMMEWQVQETLATWQLLWDALGAAFNMEDYG
jgi:hypothetical protein